MFLKRLQYVTEILHEQTQEHSAQRDAQINKIIVLTHLPLFKRQVWLMKFNEGLWKTLCYRFGNYFQFICFCHDYMKNVAWAKQIFMKSIIRMLN